MSNYKIAFVILHYLTYDDTVQCVTSIREHCETSRYKIMIVDNHSVNGSLERLIQKYGNDDDIDILSCAENLGYARGNNIGIDAARERYSPDYVVVMNNDVLLLQDDTVDIIESEFQQSHFAVMGPMIYTADGRCDDNPGQSEPFNREKLIERIKASQKDLMFTRLRLNWLRLTLRVLRGKQPVKEHKTYLSRAENVQLHGCFLVFSGLYFSRFDGFYDKTFLFMEEDILFYLVRKENMKTVYTPALKIYHKEDSASNVLWTTERKKNIQKNMYMLDSARLMLELLEHT